MLRRSLARLSPLFSKGALRPKPIALLPSVSSPSRSFCSSQTQTPTVPPGLDHDSTESSSVSTPSVAISIDRSGLYNPPGWCIEHYNFLYFFGFKLIIANFSMFLYWKSMRMSLHLTLSLSSISRALSRFCDVNLSYIYLLH
jgi:hypothetical protein